MLNEELEAAHRQQLENLCYAAFLELRDTITPGFKAKELGYENADHARLTIVTFAVKRMDKLSAEFLRKVSK